MLTENASKNPAEIFRRKGFDRTDRCDEYVCTVVDRFISAGTADDRYRICCDTFDGQFDAGQFFLLFRSGDSAVWAGK